MKFLMIVLAIHFIGEVISQNKKTPAVNKESDEKEKVIHPAEHKLRE